MFSCFFNAGKGEDEAQSGENGVQNNSRPLNRDVSVKEQAKAYVPSWQREGSAAPATGRRKPSNATKRPSTTSDRRKGEVRPTDYLYFGDGAARNYASNPGASQSQTQASDNGLSFQSQSGGVSGNDSGNQATGLDNTAQMGYASMVYVDSLQADNSGMQSFG
ncbi:hypothetical protein VPNG_01220 [Cytospora leucostoma]|uniref:Uncharacterized protein n=1 Tax=Cytospora leucostoma TaxID=1230097 RepID=A0A423XL64_9PEZI|nr:hypothetical protein VPNG_01220 [Cytospora leucostoma]